MSILLAVGIRAKERVSYETSLGSLGRISRTSEGEPSPERAFNEGMSLLQRAVVRYGELGEESAASIAREGTRAIEAHWTEHQLRHGVSEWGITFDILTQATALSREYQDITRDFLTRAEDESSVPVMDEVIESLPEKRDENDREPFWQALFDGKPDLRHLTVGATIASGVYALSVFAPAIRAAGNVAERRSKTKGKKK